MDAAKRVYLYLVSGVSLLVLAIGLYNLVAYLFGEIADSLGASVIGGSGGTGREQVSLAIALVAVGLPLFAIHWTLVGRSWRGTDAAAAADRHSALRAFHLGLVATVALFVAVFSSLEIIGRVLGTALGADRLTDAGISGALAGLVVAVPIWWYHARRRFLDLRHDRLTDGAAWLTRLHRYGWALVGLLMLVTATSSVIDILASVAIGRADFGATDRWWIASIASSIAAVFVGSAVFAIHGYDARGVIRDREIIGEDDRTTATRAAYFGSVMLGALAYVSVAAASSIAGLGRWPLSLQAEAGMPAFLETVVGPLLVAIPFAVAGWAHWAAQRREAVAMSPVAAAAATRLAVHLIAGVGLAFLAVGVGQLLGRLVEVALGASVVDDVFGTEVVWFVAQILVGAALWIPAWAAIMRRRAAGPETERRAVIGRAYLYLVVGASLVAAVPSAVFTLYRLIDTLLGGRGVALGSDVAIPIAVVIVASVVAAYHGLMLVADMRFATEADLATGETVEARSIAVTALTGTAPEGAEASLTLTLRGPAGVDLESVADRMRERLPAGVILVEGA